MQEALTRDKCLNVPRSPLRFVQIRPLLPYDYNELHAHIIDVRNIIENTDVEEAIPVDAAVTCLYNYDLRVLSKFFDPQIDSFTFSSTHKEDKWKFMVLRADTRFFVSKYALVC